MKDSNCTKGDDTRAILNDLRIASPCSVPWNTMGETGNEAVRFCGQCSKKVYDISKLTTAEAGLLVQQGQASGNMACMQLYRRFDGTIITDDCPVGLRRMRDTWRRVKSVAAAAVAFFILGVPVQAQNRDQKATRGKVMAPSQSQTPGYRGEPQVTGGEPQMTGGKPVAPTHTSGIVAPQFAIKNATGNWEEVAMKKPSVKALSERIKKLESKPDISESDINKTLRLRLQMAQEADKQMVPAFAQTELAKVYEAALSLKLKEHADKSLLRDILKARIDNAQTLKVDDSVFKEQLKKLEK